MMILKIMITTMHMIQMSAIYMHTLFDTLMMMLMVMMTTTKMMTMVIKMMIVFSLLQILRYGFKDPHRQR